MSPLPSWHFREMSRGEINVDPVHDEFFKAQDLTDALVREAIQNSLDARRGHSTVRVRFRLATGVHALPLNEAQKYLDGLLEHVAIVAPEMQLDLPRDGEPMSYLLVEDFGTRGLVGDPAAVPELDEEDGARNDFYYFWRNVGRSNKAENERGRWGLGKAVFSVSSRVRAIFGLTLRPDDDRPLLLGQCVLRTHVAGDHRVSPYGFWGRNRPDDFVVPVDGERFLRDFGLQRAEPGLSIVVPFPREADLRFENLIASATRQYFYPITRGDLVVVIEDGDRKETIDAKSIERIAKAFEADAKLVALARWSIVNDERTIIPAAPKWSEQLLPKAEMEPLRRRFESGERLAFRIGLAVKKRKGRTHAMSYFDVVLEKDDSLRRGEHHFIRRGITIPDVRSTRDKPLRALLIADDEPISTFLGDAENPAHSDWSERADKIRALYDHGASTLRYVKNAIAQIAALVSTPPEGRVRDFLADIFSIDIAGDDARDSVTEEAPGPKIPIAAGEMQGVSFAKVDGGFTLRGSGGRTVIAEAAYRTRNGNPFRKYSELDFILGKDGVTCAASGADLRLLGGNRIAVTPRGGDYQVTVSGFDRRRDVVVHVSENKDDAPETELH
jgi:hypothetical protein